jgi:hypothetical protein
MQNNPRVPQSHSRAHLARESAIEHDRLVSHDEDDAYSRRKPLPFTANGNQESDVQTRTTARRNQARACGLLSRRKWKFGLHAGLDASILVLLGNSALLLTATITSDDNLEGISTIAKGQKRQIAAMSTAYHVLINIMSTVLLTSTNYAMQILCAPTRSEIEKGHNRGHWLDIGIMSLHNLRHIDRKRVIVWVLLAFSSAPLHLL